MYDGFQSVLPDFKAEITPISAAIFAYFLVVKALLLTLM